jgi:hypothetical protein
MGRGKSWAALISIMMAAGCAQQGISPDSDGRVSLSDGDYTLTLTAGNMRAECQSRLPDGKQQHFSVVDGVVKQERLPYIQVRSGDINIDGENFSAVMTGPVFVRSKLVITLEGQTIDDGFEGVYRASAGFEPCNGKFELIRA